MKKSELLKIAQKYHVSAYQSWTKARLLDAIDSRLKTLISSVEEDIAHHEQWSKSYFWTSYGNAASRRKQEEDNSYAREIKIGEDTYTYKSSVSASCKNVYYKGTFTLNGNDKNLRLWRGLLSRLEGARSMS